MVRTGVARRLFGVSQQMLRGCPHKRLAKEPMDAELAGQHIE